MVLTPMVNSAADIWLPVWSRIVGLDGFTYHLGLPLVFCSIALTAAVVARSLAIAAGKNPNDPESDQEALSRS